MKFEIEKYLSSSGEEISDSKIDSLLGDFGARNTKKASYAGRKNREIYLKKVIPGSSHYNFRIDVLDAMKGLVSPDDTPETLIEKVKKELVLYHYTSEQFVNSILKKGYLISISKLPKDHPEVEKYTKRLSSADPYEYFENIYNTFYKNALNKPYNNDYGIYLTPLDLFTFQNNFSHRFAIPYKRIKGDIVIQIGKNVKKVNNENDIKNVLDKYTSEEVQRLWNKSKLRFLRLPQIVVFTDKIKVSKSDLEIR